MDQRATIVDEACLDRCLAASAEALLGLLSRGNGVQTPVAALGVGAEIAVAGEALVENVTASGHLVDRGPHPHEELVVTHDHAHIPETTARGLAWAHLETLASPPTSMGSIKAFRTRLLSHLYQPQTSRLVSVLLLRRPTGKVPGLRHRLHRWREQIGCQTCPCLFHPLRIPDGLQHLLRRLHRYRRLIASRATISSSKDIMAPAVITEVDGVAIGAIVVAGSVESLKHMVNETTFE